MRSSRVGQTAILPEAECDMSLTLEEDAIQNGNEGCLNNTISQEDTVNEMVPEHSPP